MRREKNPQRNMSSLVNKKELLSPLTYCYWLLVIGREAAVPCICASTAFDSKTVDPPLVAKIWAKICPGMQSTHQDRGEQITL